MILVLYFECFIVLISGSKTVLTFDGNKITKTSNDILLYKTNSTTCENDMTLITNLEGSNENYCGINCKGLQPASIYNFPPNQCEKDSLIITENKCSGYGIKNDIRKTKIQVVSKTELTSQLNIYHADENIGNIISTFRCTLQNEIYSVYYRNYSSGWENFGFGNCIQFEDSTAKIQFLCDDEKLKQFAGVMIKMYITCQLTENSKKTSNGCVIFKVEGNRIDEDMPFLVPPGPSTTTILTTTAIPLNGSDEFMEVYGWLIMGVVVFLLLVVLLIVLVCVCRRKREYDLKKSEANIENQTTRRNDSLQDIMVHQDNKVILKKLSNAKSLYDMSFANSVFESDEKESNTSQVYETPKLSSNSTMDDTDSSGKSFSKSDTLPIHNNDDKEFVNSLTRPYASISDSSNASTSDSKKDGSLPKAVYEEIPLKTVKVVKPKRKKFSNKKHDQEILTSSDYATPVSIPANQLKASSMQFWKKKQALKRPSNENSLYKKLKIEKKESSSSEDCSSCNNDTKRKSITSTRNNQSKLTTFENNNANKHVYTNDETVVPVTTVTKFDSSLAFTDTSSDTDSSNSLKMENMEPEHYSVPPSHHDRNDELLNEAIVFDQVDASNNINENLKLSNEINHNTDSQISDDEKVELSDSEVSKYSDTYDESDSIHTPPPLPKKQRMQSLYGNSNIIIDELYSKPHFPPIAAMVDDSTKVFYDIIPTIKGDQESSIKINFRRPLPEGLQITRLPYSQFNYGLRNRKDGNSSCNGFCLLAANYFFGIVKLELDELRINIPNFLQRAEKIWHEGNIGSTTVEEADHILNQLLVTTYNIEIGEELFWSIDQGLGGFSAFEALHEIYDKCVNSHDKECLVLTFYPDKSCICLFDEHGNQVFIDLHIHFKSNHQDRNSALNDNECGGVVCKAEKSTSDVLLNYIVSNMCLEMKADSKTGSAYPITLSRKKMDFL